MNAEQVFILQLPLGLPTHLIIDAHPEGSLNSCSTTAADPHACSRATAAATAAVEDHYNVLAQYYSLPALSLRDAMWHQSPDLSKTPDYMLEDQRHPNVLGHHYMADLAVGLIQHTIEQMLLHPIELSGKLNPKPFTLTLNSKP